MSIFNRVFCSFLMTLMVANYALCMNKTKKSVKRLIQHLPPKERFKQDFYKKLAAKSAKKDLKEKKSCQAMNKAATLKELEQRKNQKLHGLSLLMQKKARNSTQLWNECVQVYSQYEKKELKKSV